MDKRGSIELLNLERENTNYNKNLSLDSIHSNSLNLKQENVSVF